MTDKIQLVADIGGTNARFAYVITGSDELQSIRILSCADYPSILDAILKYVKDTALSNVDCLCMAVAAVVGQDDIDISNNHWSFSRARLQACLGFPVFVINDFTAQMLSVDTLHESELMWLGPIRPGLEGVKAIIGPGTGLGMSAILPDGAIVPSEGGHIAFAPLNDHQQALHTELRGRLGRVSAEQVLSGPGLSNLYWANSKLAGAESELSAAEICAGAFAGNSLCLNTISDFWKILGAVAGDVALMMGANAGVYISGGVALSLLGFLNQGQVRKEFDSKGTFSYICMATPLAVVLAQQPGLRGSVSALRAFKREPDCRQNKQ